MTYHNYVRKNVGLVSLGIWRSHILGVHYWGVATIRTVVFGGLYRGRKLPISNPHLRHGVKSFDRSHGVRSQDPSLACLQNLVGKYSGPAG